MYRTGPGRAEALRHLLLGLAATAACLGVVLAQGPEESGRARLLALQREAAALVRKAARADGPAAERAAALTAASERVASLAAAAGPGGSSGETRPAVLAEPVRQELERAGRGLLDASRTGGERFEPTPYLALLERVRVLLAGEVALGLAFEGSYSQSRARDPAYGGHASGMGPAPAAAPDDQGPPSPVTFEEGARLPARTYCGGPTKDHILESAGSGAALVDYDGDGLLDIYLVTAPGLTPSRERIPHRNVLYRNRGGWTFEDVSARAGVDAAAWGSGVCAGDADGDGWLDLYVTNWGGNFLFRNRGDGTFEEIAARAGVAAGGWSTGCAFLDADADGDLDLYVARYVETTWEAVVNARRTLIWRNGPRIMVGPAGLSGEADLFFVNDGTGRFTEAAAAHGLADAARAYGFAVVSTDYDDDGWVDLFVANDSNPNFLYRNRGGGVFESVALLAGVGVNDEARAQAGMGADAGDYDGDGRLDLVLTAFAYDRNTIYRNVDGGAFEDAAAAAGLSARTFVRMGWGVAFLDADLDGRPDLYVANGHIFSDIDAYPELGETYRQADQLLLNAGGRFRDVSASAGGGLRIAHSSRGLAVGDLDNDGDPDVLVTNMDETPTLLENRQRTGHHWVAFRLTAPRGNRFAIGAKVAIRANGRRQVREVRSGGSFLSQSDLRPHFGLGTYGGPVDVEVRMPGGKQWRFPGLEADRLHVLKLTDQP